MIRLASLAVVALVAVGAVGAGCSTPKEAAPQPPRIMPYVAPDSSTVKHTNRAADMEAVKKQAADQLQCPLDKINVVCLRKDSDGECIRIRADGCDKSYEYQFGES